MPPPFDLDFLLSSINLQIYVNEWQMQCIILDLYSTCNAFIELKQDITGLYREEE
jgi:hypothetical protein